MKNKTSACNLQVINHLTTVKKKIIRAHDAGAMDTSKPLHRRRCRVIAAHSPKPVFFFFFSAFWRAGGGKASVSSVATVSPDAARTRPLQAPSPHIPDPHVLRRQSFRSGLSRGGHGLPGSLPQWPAAKAGHGLWAPLQLCSHPWGVPCWHQG